MTKAQLIARLKDLPDDTRIEFARFTYRPGLSYHFQLMDLTLQSDNDPAQVIALIDCAGLVYETTRDIVNDRIHEFNLEADHD